MTQMEVSWQLTVESSAGVYLHMDKQVLKANHVLLLNGEKKRMKNGVWLFYRWNIEIHQ